MDYALVTKPARYLWEIEIKMTAADWRADEHKRKWLSKSRHLVSRFFYAVPPELLDNIPTFVGPEIGLLAIHPGHISAARPARVSKAAPALTDKQLMTLLESTHFRFWRERNHRHVAAWIRQKEREAA